MCKCSCADSKETAGAPEIEITSEMIDAGVTALGADDLYDWRETVENILRSCLSASRKSRENGPATPNRLGDATPAPR
jgi:hypothetical protein